MASGSAPSETQWLREGLGPRSLPSFGNSVIAFTAKRQSSADRPAKWTKDNRESIAAGRVRCGARLTPRAVGDRSPMAVSRAEPTYCKHLYVIML
jgi:hypothetical protein